MSVTDLKTEETTVVEEPEGKKKKPLLAMLVLVLVVAVAAAAWWFLLRPAEADQAPEPGEVLELEPIQVNLADGHYLKIGIALQAVEGAEHVEGSKALDATIDLFSGSSMEDLANRKSRHTYKEELLEELHERYHGEVMEVYFTDFVTQ